MKKRLEHRNLGAWNRKWGVAFAVFLAVFAGLPTNAQPSHDRTTANTAATNANNVSSLADTVGTSVQRVHQRFPRRVPIQSAQEPRSTPIPRAVSLGLNIAPYMRDLGPLTAERLAQAEAEAVSRCNCDGSLPPRTGLVRPVAFEGFTPESGWHAVSLPDGARVWLFAVRSPGAFGLRLHFRNCDLGDRSAQVWASAKEAMIVGGSYSAKGPDGTGDFWTASLPGDTAYIEVSGDSEPRMDLTEIVHLDRNVLGADGKDGPLGDATWCHLDVMCYNSPPVDPVARDAVVQLNFVSGGNHYICTGTILSTLDDETAVPYLLTAYHCLHTQSEAASLEAVWFWQRSSCGGGLPDYTKLPRLVGGTLLESNPTSGGNDMAFIRLWGRLPAGGTLAGWTTHYSDSSYGIHHPAGDWKRVTFFHDSYEFFSGCLFNDAKDYHFVKADDGFIEGGSSGSPLLNSAGQVMGQLYGTCCDVGNGTECQGIDCSSNRDSWRNVYGEFETTYPIIYRWLAIGGTIHVDWANFNPFGGTGTPDNPFRTVSDAHDFAWDSTRIKIKPGSYHESLTLSKRVMLIADGGPVTIGP